MRERKEIENGLIYHSHFPEADQAQNGTVGSTIMNLAILAEIMLDIRDLLIERNNRIGMIKTFIERAKGGEEGGR